MLAALLAVRYPHFADLAESWLATGATAFGIWHNGRPLAHWPGADDLAAPGLVAPIRLGATVIGDLRVAGLSDANAQARLAAEAALVSAMVQLEDELQRMTADLVESRDQLLALYRMAPVLRGHASLERALTSLLGEAIRLIKAQSGFAVFVPDSDGPTLIQHPERHLDEALVWRCFWHAHANNYVGLPPAADVPSALPPGIQNLLFLPLPIRGAIAAGLGLVNKPGAGFTAPDIKLARAIAEQTSAQIENVLLAQETAGQARLQSEMDLARRVQARLLPQHAPSVAGLELVAHSRPVFHVGGDFYDFVALPERPFIFTVGDVVGKGLSAALLMTMTRAALHSKAAFLPDPTPQAIIRQANADMYGHFTQVGSFATAFVGCYRPAERLLTYANAGHAPVIYRPRDGAPVLLEADGTAIGVLTASLCRDRTVELGPGDLLVVATDGFIDARDPTSAMFGCERLLHLVDSLAGHTPREIADAIYHAIGHFEASRPQDDDQTLVVIKGVAA